VKHWVGFVSVVPNLVKLNKFYIHYKYMTQVEFSC